MQKFGNTKQHHVSTDWQQAGPTPPTLTPDQVKSCARTVQEEYKKQAGGKAVFNFHSQTQEFSLTEHGAEFFHQKHGTLPNGITTQSGYVIPVRQYCV